MAATRSLLHYVCGLVLLACCAQALRFDLHATGSHEGKKERCIRNFVARDTLVVVTATVDGHKGDGMVVNMHVRGLKEEGAPLSLDWGCWFNWIGARGGRRGRGIPSPFEAPLVAYRKG